MDLRQEQERVSEELKVALAEAAKWEAKVKGLRAELDSLARSAHAADNRDRTEQESLPDMRMLSRMAAIEEVLRLARKRLSINEILSTLSTAGRTGDTYPVVSASLQYLLREGRVRRPARGTYEAA